MITTKDNEIELLRKANQKFQDHKKNVNERMQALRA